MPGTNDFIIGPLHDSGLPEKNEKNDKGGDGWPPEGLSSLFEPVSSWKEEQQVFALNSEDNSSFPFSEAFKFESGRKEVEEENSNLSKSSKFYCDSNSLARRPIFECCLL